MRVPTFLFPIKGLKPRSNRILNVGTVELMPPALAQEALAETPRGHHPPEAAGQRGTGFVDSISDVVVARVKAESGDDAIDAIEAALDVLRVFWNSRALGEMLSFGLTEGVLGDAVYFANLDSGGVGWLRIGHFTGAGLTDETCAAFEDSEFARLPGAAVGAINPNGTSRRALVATRLASRALTTHDPSMRTVLAMTAAEVLMFGENETSTTFQLARRSTFLLCGAHSASLCGRDRDSCVILTTDPDGGAKGLKKLRRLGNVDVRWRCSEWHRVLDWYDLRSRVLHSGEPVSGPDASRVVFWLVHELIPEALRWFAAHLEDPDTPLREALASLPDPPEDERSFDEVYDELASRGAFTE